ncbi:unnamed protein product [Chrysoparadoxa australica]
MEALDEEEVRLDQLLVYVKQQLALIGEAGTKGDMFLQQEDIRDLPCYKNDTVMAIRAPAGTTLEVPDPDEGVQPGQRRYQIYLKSHNGPIDVYLVSKVQEEGGSRGPVHPTTDRKVEAAQQGGQAQGHLPSQQLMPSQARPQQAQPQAQTQARAAVAPPVMTAAGALGCLSSPTTSLSDSQGLGFHGLNGLNGLNGLAALGSGDYTPSAALTPSVTRLSPIKMDQEFGFNLDDRDGITELFVGKWLVSPSEPGFLLLLLLLLCFNLKRCDSWAA